MRTIKTLLLLIVFLILANSCGSEKIITRSHEDSPSWRYGLSQNYLVGVGEDKSIENAKKIAFEDVKSQIVESIGVQIKVYTESKQSEIVVNGESNMNSSFSTHSFSESISNQFIQEISLIHAADFYFEQIRKNRNERMYRYYIQYPFSRNEVLNYLKKWELKQLEIQDKLQGIKLRLANKNYDSESQVKSDLLLLENIEKNYSGIYKEQIGSSLKEQLNSIYDKVTLKVVKNQPNSFEVLFLWEDKPFEISTEVSILNNSGIRFISKEFNGFSCNINYDYSNCDLFKDHTIKIEYIINNKVRAFESVLNIMENDIVIYVEPPIIVEYVDGSFLNNEDVLICKLNVKSLNNNAFVVGTVELNFKHFYYNFFNDPKVENKGSMTFDINKRFAIAGNGYINQKVTVPYFNNYECNSTGAEKCFVSGSIQYYSKELKKYKVYRFNEIEYVSANW